MKFYHFASLLLAISIFAACKKEDDSLSPEEQLQVDIDIIQTYLTDNNLTAQSTASGLHYIIEEEGTSANPTTEDPVIFEYTGYFTNNTEWGKSYYGPEVFNLNSIPLGFKEGIPLFKIGGKGKLLVPSALAFGPAGISSVPPNSVMIFDVELPELCLSDSTLTSKVSCLDQIKIQQYLTENNLTAEVTASGLHYIIEEPGVGNAYPVLTDLVEVFYKGYLLTGSVFDQTSTDPAVFQLSGVIDGWKEGIRLFKKGGKGKLFIPSDLAYGASPPSGSGIPANGVLVFDIELKDF